jgi:DNA-binding response OmpR family regulator
MATLTTTGTSQFKQRTTAVERVLFVEDDVTLQNIIRGALISEGYKVETLSSGPVGLTLVRRESLSALIIHSQFPASPEHDLCREFMQAVPPNPFVLLSTTPYIGDNALFSEMESDDPPLIVKELVARLGCLPRRGVSVTIRESLPFWRHHCGLCENGSRSWPSADSAHDERVPDLGIPDKERTTGDQPR